jgi:hypothetical protein
MPLTKIYTKNMLLKYTYDNVKIIQGNTSEVKVRYMPSVHKVSGPEFTDLKVECVDTLKKIV